MKLRLLTIILASSVLLYFLHSFAQTYNLYYDVTWFDMVTHALGGMVIAAAFVYARLFVFKRQSAGMVRAIIFTFIVGVMWEIFEATFGLTAVSDPVYPLDTAGDLFFDIFGAYLFMLAYKPSHE